MTIARRLFILFGMSILALALSAGVALASDDSGGVEAGDDTIQVGQISPNLQATSCGNAVAVQTQTSSFGSSAQTRELPCY